MTLGTAQGVRSRALGRSPDCGKGRLSARIQQPEGHGRAFFQRCEFWRFTVTVTRGTIAAYRVRLACSSVRTHTPGWVAGVVRPSQPVPFHPFAVHFSFSFYTYPKGYVYKNENEEMPRRGPLFCFSISTVHPQPPRNLTRNRHEKPMAAPVIRTRPSMRSAIALATSRQGF